MCAVDAPSQNLAFGGAPANARWNTVIEQGKHRIDHVVGVAVDQFQRVPDSLLRYSLELRGNCASQQGYQPLRVGHLATPLLRGNHTV
jgi:hypothetical protein